MKLTDREIKKQASHIRRKVRAKYFDKVHKDMALQASVKGWEIEPIKTSIHNVLGLGLTVVIGLRWKVDDPSNALGWRFDYTTIRVHKTILK